jgi:hypothetical protein
MYLYFVLVIANVPVIFAASVRCMLDRVLKHQHSSYFALGAEVQM